MSRLRLRVVALGLALLVLPGLAAASAPSGPPARLLGLVVKQENVGRQLATDIAGSGRQHYFDHIRLFSVRRADGFLQATLELGHFRPGTADGEDYFRRSLVDQVGAAEPIATWADGTLVDVTSQRGLTIAMWFRGHTMLILSIRDSFDQPKSLIRQALAITP